MYKASGMLLLALLAPAARSLDGAVGCAYRLSNGTSDAFHGRIRVQCENSVAQGERAMNPRLIVPMILVAVIAAATASPARGPHAQAAMHPDLGPIAWELKPDSVPLAPFPRDSMRRDSVPRDTMRRDTIPRDTTHHAMPRRVPKQPAKPHHHTA
jgi:hypothetical protein